MHELMTNPRYILALATMLLSAIFCLLFIIRSIWLRKPMNPDVHGLYAVFIAFGVVGALAFAGAISSDVVSALVGAAVGFTGAKWATRG